MDNFQQTVDLRGKIERSKKVAPAKKITPLEKIYQEEDEVKPKADLKTISQPKAKEPREGLVRIIVFILAILVVGATVYFLFFRTKGWFNKPAEVQTWYAVKLVNGEIFYGQIFDTKADPVAIANVYYNYDQAKEKEAAKAPVETGNLRLVKRGQETHGPAGTMDIVRTQVLFMEPLKTDSKVLQAILQYEK
ncbi:MAG: hypothetical protein Q8O59_01335 [bacterium]|nr:hypothetical protein [bacterium]